MFIRSEFEWPFCLTFLRVCIISFENSFQVVLTPDLKTTPQDDLKTEPMAESVSSSSTLSIEVVQKFVAAPPKRRKKAKLVAVVYEEGCTGCKA
jgi:hypothetical protein